MTYTHNRTHKSEAPLDRAQEDRTVEYLRSHGVFGGRATLTSAQPTVSPKRAGKWRVPMIAAAAAVLLAFITMLADRMVQPSADDTPSDAPTPRLLIWY